MIAAILMTLAILPLAERKLGAPVPTYHQQPLSGVDRWLDSPAEKSRLRHRMSKITKGLRKQAKKEKKAVKKARKEDKKVDTSSVPLKSPFAT